MRRAADLKLFQDRDKNWVTYGELVQAMRDVKADDCDVLLVHTDLSFGLPTRELKRKELVAVLYDAICELGVKTLCFLLLHSVMATGKTMMSKIRSAKWV